MLHFPMLRAAMCALMLALGASAAVAQQAAAPDPARIAAAKDLMEVTGVNKQLDGMIAAMGQGFRKGAADAADAATAEAAGKEFDSHMARLMSYRQAMLDDFAALYAEKFTAEELKSVADFYRSPTGAKFIQTMPELIQSGALIGMKYSQKAMQGEQPKR
jgi:hypothetical protein